MKRLIGLYSPPHGHWVGDGFPVRSLFSYNNQGQHLSPFLLLDHAGPARFEPTTAKRKRLAKTCGRLMRWGRGA